jgi:ABC-2 type transport system ATP-binding protein
VTDPGAGITVRDLSKRFGDVVALDGLSLDVRPGELVALLGRNGAGKTTLMRVLGTTVLPDAGHALVAGNDVVRASAEARRCCGLVLGDERSWYWRLTGRANLEFFAALYGLRRRAARERAGELLDLLDLSDVADRRFDGYSAGMRTRLSLARSLLVEPPVLLLDEPSRTLDPVVAVGFRDLVRSLARERGRAVLWVSHDLHEVAAVADRAVVVDHGRVVAHDDRPRDAAALERLLTGIVA